MQLCSRYQRRGKSSYTVVSSPHPGTKSTQVTITDWFAADVAIGGDFSTEVDFTAATGLFFAFPRPEKED